MPIYFYISRCAINRKIRSLVCRKIITKHFRFPMDTEKSRRKKPKNDVINVKMPQNLICNSQNLNQNSWNWCYNSKNWNSDFLLKGK